MGAKFSCLINDISICDYPDEAPVPARPVSQAQLSQRQSTRHQPLQLEYSHAHGAEVPRYRRQCAQPPRPRRQSLPVVYSNSEEDGLRFRHPVFQRQWARGLRGETEQEYEYGYGYGYGHDEDEDENIASFAQYLSQRPRSQGWAVQSEDPDGDIPATPDRSPPRQFPRRLFPRRRSLQLQHSDEVDPDVLRCECCPRRHSMRAGYEIVALPLPMYEGQLGERRDGRGQSLRGSQVDVLDETPPIYGDHVFDRLVDDGG
ncbi:MAG: hypothetical protein Q9161_002355 [Pseudevernia consocians]